MAFIAVDPTSTQVFYGLSTDTLPPTGNLGDLYIITDIVNLADGDPVEGSWQGTGWFTRRVKVTDSKGRPAVTMVFEGSLANEQGIGTSAQIGVSIPKCNATVVDVATVSTDVSLAPAQLLGVYVNATIAVEAVGIHDGTGGVEKFTLPIGLAEGSYVPFYGTLFDNAIFIESTAATGSISVLWWALP